LNAKHLARSGALAFAMLAILATAIELSHEGKVESPAVMSAATEADPLRRELLRCRSLGEASDRDEGCRRAWAENLQQFLAGSDRRSPAGGEEGK
jgi:conjugative transfer region protein TrbK